MSPPRFSLDRSSLAFWLLAAFLVCVFLLGGASRVDVQSLAILRPLSVVVCAAALLTIRRVELVRQPVLFIGALLIVALGVIQLVPLPPALWSALPGRDAVAVIDRIAGLGAVWRPLTLTPSNGWHSLLALFAPLAVLLLGVQARRRDLRRLLPLLIGFAAVSGLFGLMQVIGPTDGPFYLYRVTNVTSAVGLFANRNHAALLLALAFPMLATWAVIAGGRDRPTRFNPRTRAVIAAALGVFLFPLVIVTGSRSGFVLSLLGIAVAITIYLRAGGLQLRDQAGRLPAGSGRWRAVVLAALAGIALIGLTVYFAKGEAISRLFGNALTQDTRAEDWKISLAILWRYFPFGTGAGSYAEVFQIYEPGASINSYYSNHVHNDFIEIGLTFGLAGIGLICAASALYARRIVELWRDSRSERRSARLAWLAATAILLIGAASAADYPLRTPSFSCIFAVMLLWLFEAGRDDEPQPGPDARSERGT